MRIKDYPETNTLSPNDVFVIDGEKGTGCIKAGMLRVASFDNLLNHRNTFRGKNLGNTFTETQKKAIREGTFDDIYVGDYWTDGSRKWRVMDIDYFDYIDIEVTSSTHHLIIMPDDVLYQARYHSTSDKKIGYVGTELRDDLPTKAKPYFSSFFGEDHLSSDFSAQLITGLTKPISNVSLYSLTFAVTPIFIELASSYQVFGRGRYIENYGSMDRQFKAFEYCPSLIRNENRWWLSAPYIASDNVNDMSVYVTDKDYKGLVTGGENLKNTPANMYVRPYAIIKG